MSEDSLELLAVALTVVNMSGNGEWMPNLLTKFLLIPKLVMFGSEFMKCTVSSINKADEVSTLNSLMNDWFWLLSFCFLCCCCCWWCSSCCCCCSCCKEVDSARVGNADSMVGLDTAAVLFMDDRLVPEFELAQDEVAGSGADDRTGITLLDTVGVEIVGDGSL